MFIITEKPKLDFDFRSDIASQEYVVREDNGTVTVCLTLSRLADFSFNVTLEAVESSPVSAQGYTNS